MKVLNKGKLLKLRQLEHVKNEKATLQHVNHPFLVHLYGTHQDEANLYLFMEYVPGGELFNLIRRFTRLTEPTARFYAAEILLALEYLHSQNIIFRFSFAY